jgi:hypothetical protein
MTPKSRNSTLLCNGSVNEFPAEMNTHATVELPILCNDEVNTLCNNTGIVRKMCFLLGPTWGYITRISGSWEIELRETLEMAVEDDWEQMTTESVEFRDASLAGYELGSRIELRTWGIRITECGLVELKVRQWREDFTYAIVPRYLECVTQFLC